MNEVGLPSFGQNTCTTPAALVQITHQTSGRTDLRTVWGGASRIARAFTKTFFTGGFKNVTVLHPGLEVPSEDDTGLQQCGPDPGAPSAGPIHQDSGGLKATQDTLNIFTAGIMSLWFRANYAPGAGGIWKKGHYGCIQYSNLNSASNSKTCLAST